MFELDYFLARPEKAWTVIREIFYDHFGRAIALTRNEPPLLR
jgi:hypothetical protein